jgi:cyclophilin family peptidyl-prolyl cis-trans isomerase
MRPLLLALLMLAAAPAHAANPVVRFSTTLGDFDVELCEATSALCERAAPDTVANFLAYVDDGDYADSIVHRSISGFVIQGGSFRVSPGPLVTAVPTDAPVQNEFSGFPNRRGTLAVPLQPGSGPAGNPCNTAPDSGTSGWFVNLDDNSATIDCGLLTVFGVVIGGEDGMSVPDEIALLQKLRFFFPQTSQTYPFLLPLFDPDHLVSAFTDVPFPDPFVEQFLAYLNEEGPEPSLTDVTEAFVRVDVARVPEAGAAGSAGVAALALAALRRRRATR